MSALPTGLEPDKSSPRTAVGVAVPFKYANIVGSMCKRRADQTVAPLHAG